MEIKTKTIPENFAPTDEQIFALARRLAPEIKTLFADELIQQEFEKWQKEQDTAI
jgi:predicted ABC-type transport system involved in lysophospholipase L1 biosynthesis ATPase subunit